MPKRLLMLCLLVALSALSTGCCGRIRHCIANRWHAHGMYGGYGGACCTPAFKVPTAAGCSTCGPEAGGIIYQGPVGVPYGVPTIGQPTPLLGTGGDRVPGVMPPKN